MSTDPECPAAWSTPGLASCTQWQIIPAGQSPKLAVGSIEWDKVGQFKPSPRSCEQPGRFFIWGRTQRGLCYSLTPVVKEWVGFRRSRWAIQADPQGRGSRQSSHNKSH